MGMNGEAKRPIPLLDLKAQYASIKDEILPVIHEVCESQRFIGGPQVTSCEEEIAAYCGCQHGVGVTSGTDALLCGMMALGIGPGDEVIVPSFTFFATAGSVARLGAKPVFVDIDPDTYNVTARTIEPAMTPRTKLIVVVHLFGQCVEMGPILDLADKKSIPVMEDAAQSIGATHHGRRACSWGRLGILSFFPSKNLGAFGDGGMILTNDAPLADRCRILRDHGASPKYYHKILGGNFRLDALQAAVLRVKLKRLDAWSAKRAANAKRYGELFANSEVKTPTIAARNGSIYNQYVIRVSRRAELRQHLTDQGIGAEVYYPVPLHLQECFARLGGRPGQLPHSEKAAREVLALPIFPELRDEDQQRIAETIESFLTTRA